jgi:hypothetical protein
MDYMESEQHRKVLLLAVLEKLGYNYTSYENVPKAEYLQWVEEIYADNEFSEKFGEFFSALESYNPVALGIKPDLTDEEISIGISQFCSPKNVALDTPIRFGTVEITEDTWYSKIKKIFIFQYTNGNFYMIDHVNKTAYGNHQLVNLNKDNITRTLNTCAETFLESTFRPYLGSEEGDDAAKDVLDEMFHDDEAGAINMTKVGGSIMAVGSEGYFV